MPERHSGPLAGRHQPSRDAVAADPRLSISHHPLAEDLLAVIRDQRTDTRTFGTALEQLALFVLWEASRDLEITEVSVPGFDGAPVQVNQIKSSLAGVMIMRAGCVFSAPFRALFPRSPLFHLGVSRDEKTLRHHLYSDNLAQRPDQNLLLILDPMLATGGSILLALECARAVYDGAVKVVSIVAAPAGVQAVLAADPAVRILTAALDERLNDRGYILPGLGDAGDRLFGTAGELDRS